MEQRSKEKRTHQMPRTPDPGARGLLVANVARGTHTPANQKSSHRSSWDLLGAGRRASLGARRIQNCQWGW